MTPGQYDIVLVNLDPTVGSEIKETRPCLVISPDEMNKHLRTVTVSPITSKSKNYPTRTHVDIGEIIGWIALDQIRTIYKKRIIKKYSKIGFKTVKEVKAILRETLVE